MVGDTFLLFFFKQKTAYEMRISDWSSDVCSSDLVVAGERDHLAAAFAVQRVERRGLQSVVGRRAHRSSGDGRVVGAIRPRNRRPPPLSQDQIGRASCRESVCQYV